MKTLAKVFECISLEKNGGRNTSQILELPRQVREVKGQLEAEAKSRTVTSAAHHGTFSGVKLRGQCPSLPQSV